MYRLDNYDESWTDESDLPDTPNHLLDDIEAEYDEEDNDSDDWMVDELDNEGDILDSININTFEEELDEDFL